MPRLLVGYDGSPPSTRALAYALARAERAGLEVVVLTVIPPQVRRTSLANMMPAGLELPPEMSGTFEDSARRRLEDVLAEARRGRKVEVRGEVRAGDAAKTLLALAEEMGAAEIVIGRKSYEGPEFTLGHNGNAVLRGAGVPVVVVP